jgi:SAM-dependent methyltransferase
MQMYNDYPHHISDQPGAEFMSESPQPYVHGRSDRESIRLHDQASGLGLLLHEGTRYPPGSTVLEAGCGVGAQTIILAGNSPHAQFVSIDISPESLAKAQERVSEAGYTNVTFRQADICSMQFPAETFDHVFVCFTLEHIRDPLIALDNIMTVLRPGGTITVIEGDHGSAIFYPDTPVAHLVIDCLVILQRQAGGNALIGRELEHLLAESGFVDLYVSPRQTYASQNIPHSSEAVKKIFIAMIEGVREQAIAGGLADPDAWDQGIRDLYRTTRQGGMFCYTFFKALGRKRIF